MSLRLKLLLLGLLTLVLPWAGCQYAREMETVLRASEQQALDAVARTIAASLQGRRDLLYLHGDAFDDAEAGPFDLQPVPLAAEPFLDGYADEWTHEPAAWRSFTRGEDRLRVFTGVHERFLYLLIDVSDGRPIFDAQGAGPLDSDSFGDRIWLGFEDPDGAERQMFIAATGPGPVHARYVVTGEYGRQDIADEPRISGAWRLTSSGYVLELRMPLSMVGRRLGVLVDDRDERGALPASYGSLDGDDLHTLGRLIVPSPDLGAYLEQFLQPGQQLTVRGPTGVRLAQAGELTFATDLGVQQGILATLYRRLLDRPGERRVVQAEVPVMDADRQQVLGTLQISQTTDRWLTLRDQALTKLLNVTVITSIGAVLAMFAFAAWLALRLSRLRRASETALTREGLVTTFPETAATDELGDLARSFSTLLGRLNEYTGYLRTLAGKLAHEIRTPLTIVRSSLENLESEPLTPSARTYVARAREGSERLNAILVAMGAATRVEEAIQSAERTRFDLAALLASAAESYRSAFPERAFAVELPGEPVEIDGAPDLIVQMLDKLVDNAVDFSPAGATITLRLRVEPGAAVVEVDNPGPPLEPGTAARLFESLWQSRRSGRSGSDGRPHFGLGLYIVRLIAEFHGGFAQASSLPGETGARFSVRLAR